jgi:ribosomal protein S18 acetylase RimI-like enzyme
MKRLARRYGREEAIFVMEIRPFEDVDEDAVIALWERCGLLRSWNDPRQDIARKRRLQRELFLVGTADGAIIATVMAGYDGHRGWINYLAVDPAQQRKGFGRALMDEAARRLEALGCPKINLQVRRENTAAVSFYQRIGFREDAVLSFGKRLEHGDSK